jgi:F0F1-type ATP synthase assembly protein I
MRSIDTKKFLINGSWIRTAVKLAFELTCATLVTFFYCYLMDREMEAGRLLTVCGFILLFFLWRVRNQNSKISSHH